VTNSELLCSTVKKIEVGLSAMKLLEGRRKKFFGVYPTSQIFIMYDKSSALVSGKCFFEDTANGDVAAVYFLVKFRPVIFKCLLQETMLVCNVTMSMTRTRSFMWQVSKSTIL
jgi:hypothetical protein